MPTFIVIVAIDSIYYKQFTCTALNFLIINLIDNRSAEFGVSPPLAFFTDYLPKAFGNFMLPFMGLGVAYYILICKNKREMPYTVIFTLFYLLIISRVPHKEARFMLPVIPYIMLMGA